MPLQWTVDTAPKPEGPATVRASLAAWTVTCSVRVRGPEPGVIGVRIDCEGDRQAPPITTRQLREVDLGGAVSAAQRAMPAAAADPAVRWRSGEPATRLERLAAVAVLYDLEISKGRRDVNRAVAEWTGQPLRQVRDDVYAARKAGLLSDGRMGRPVGRLQVHRFAAIMGLKEGNQ